MTFCGASHMESFLAIGRPIPGRGVSRILAATFFATGIAKKRPEPADLPRTHCHSLLGEGNESDKLTEEFGEVGITKPLDWHKDLGKLTLADLRTDVSKMRRPFHFTISNRFSSCLQSDTIHAWQPNWLGVKISPTLAVFHLFRRERPHRLFGCGLGVGIGGLIAAVRDCGDGMTAGVRLALHDLQLQRAGRLSLLPEPLFEALLGTTSFGKEPLITRTRLLELPRILGSTSKPLLRRLKTIIR